MIVDVIAFISGLSIGVVPSVMTYVACKRGIYADWVMHNMEEKREVIDGGVLEHRYVLIKPNKSVNVLDIANAMIKHAQLNPSEWEVVPEKRGIKINGRTMFGVRNVKDNIYCLRNHLTFSCSEDIWLTDVKVQQSVFNHVVAGVTKAVDNLKMQKMLEKLQPRKVLSSPNDSPFSDELGDRLLSDHTKHLAKKTKEAINSKTIDPFAETYNDHIYEIGKARSSMDALLEKSKLYVATRSHKN